ncbi:MAG: chromosome segregation protein SMC [Euryarchaeota archaeon]|nr:chromosome segregation protein SMC [Euryarchaeota archaeon]
MAYIKEITLHNFKSFGKRVVVSLPKGFTAVVGANGSGKSNIIDGICFVLGRRSSKSMRADRLVDLIFNGSNGRPPADFTEVSLIFDNTDSAFPIDSSNVTVSRKVNRAGYCAYRINDRMATRTEIIELLSHAAINPDGYNIIMQGDIVKIVEMNAADRRKIIDEVSGIAEYNEKKEKAMHELEKVKNNIDKINIVISEVETQLSKLKSEREDALNYKELQTKLEETRGLLINKKLSDAKAALNNLLDTLGTTEADYQKFNQELQALVSSSQESEQKLNQLNQIIAEKTEKEQLSLQKEIEEIKGTIHRAQDSIKLAQEEIERTSNEKRETELKLQRFEAEISELQKNIAQLEYQRSEVIAQIGNRSKELRDILEAVKEIDSEFAKLNDELSGINVQLEQKKDKFFAVQREMEKLRELLQSKQTEKSNVSSKLEQLKTQLVGLEANYAEAIEKQTQLQNQKSRLEIDLTKLTKQEELELREKITVIEEKLRKAQEDYARVETKLKTLEEISYPKAISEILKARDIGLLTGIYGTIAELLKVKPEHEVAIEVAAGSRLHHIVVESDEDASQAIKFLKENKIGRATFLPLNKIEFKTLDPRSIDASKAEGAIGLAINLVDFDPKFQFAFNYVFGDTVVVDNLETAKKLANGLRIVTLDGDLIDAKWAITGGFYQRRGIKSVKQEEDYLQQLKAGISQLETSKQEILVKLKELEKFVGELSQQKINVEAELTNQTLILDNAQKQIQNQKNELIQFEAQFAQLSKEIESFEVKYNLHSAELNQLQDELKQLESKKIEINEKLSSSKASDYTAKTREIEQTIYQHRETQQKLDTEIGSSKAKIESGLQPSIQTCKNNLANHQEKSEKLVNMVQQNQALILLQTQQLNLKVDLVGSLTKDVEGLRIQREQYQRTISELSVKREELYQKLASIQTVRSNLNAEKMALESKINELSIEAQKYQNLAASEVEVKISDLEQKVQTLEIEMKKLEPINMRAIEDYDNTLQRHEKLFEQNKKLTEERNAILKLMTEIDERKLAVFMEAFEAINRSFKEIFSQLSPEGEAELILENYGDPFEGGLEIRAKPAGKEVRSIESMSGGEKTLTALAFVFGLARYKPAPFYVLDEADMFLDGDNGEKFANLVKEFSKSAQFIVVSFRESMVSSADQLIGVAMQDAGSDIVSVKLGGQ